jgi:hypothetical protein
MSGSQLSVGQPWPSADRFSHYMLQISSCAAASPASVRPSELWAGSSAREPRCVRTADKQYPDLYHASHRPPVREVRWKVPHLRLVSLRSRWPAAVPVRGMLLIELAAGFDRYVRPATLVRTCDDCNFGTYGGRCIICGSQGASLFSLPTCPRPGDRLTRAPTPSLPNDQASRTHTTAPNARGSRRTATGVPRSSTSARVGQTCSTNESTSPRCLLYPRRCGMPLPGSRLLGLC